MDELRSITILGMKPKFTLRDLFWLVLVCGLALGGWVHSRNQLHRIARLEEQRDKLILVAGWLGAKPRLEDDIVIIGDLPEAFWDSSRSHK